jgi:molecular chaperone DnaK (HSP70)
MKAPKPPFKLDATLLSQKRVTEGLLCVDFGTAASKVGYDDGEDRVEPLAVGTQAGEGSPFWVTSAIAIDADGKMVFGDRAAAAAEATSGRVVTSFKSRLWGDPRMLDEAALASGDVQFTYRDCIQAYLAFLTHLAASALKAKGVSAYTPRRYAMPFAYDEQRRHVRSVLGDMLGRAALLADSLGASLVSGVDVSTMRAALTKCDESTRLPSWLVAKNGCVGEPVAAGNFAMDEEVGALTVYMIADVGAGTTDFCILCLKRRRDGDIEPLQIRDGSLSIEVAGESVDQALVDFLVRSQVGEGARKEIAANSRLIKERLFALTASEDENFDLEIAGSILLNVDRQEFLRSPEWKAFTRQLRKAQSECFDRADRAFLQGFGNAGAIRVVVTGGGSALPLMDALAKGRSPGQVKVLRTPAPDFPIAIQQRFANNLADLPRLAVSLGGSRPTLPGDFNRTTAKTTHGVTAPYVAQPFDKTKTGLESDEE